MSQLRPALVLFLLLTLFTGVIYPLITTALGQWWFSDQANGSLIYHQEQLRGSRLTGQYFSQPGYFYSRPSATPQQPYNPMASGGSNLSLNNPELKRLVTERVAKLRASDPLKRQQVPVELVTASASGLDYGISPDAALWQLPRVAKARNISEARLSALIQQHTSQPLLRFIGPPTVNVVELNLALDQLSMH